MSVRRPQAKSAKLAGSARAGGTGADHGSAPGDALAELLRALVDLQQAEDAAAKAAWLLAEAEDDDPVRPAEVERARVRYEAAVAAVEAARVRRRELEARFDPVAVTRAHSLLAGGGRG